MIGTLTQSSRSCSDISDSQRRSAQLRTARIQGRQGSRQKRSCSASTSTTRLQPGTRARVGLSGSLSHGVLTSNDLTVLPPKAVMAKCQLTYDDGR
jgi:hypothetical protein